MVYGKAIGTIFMSFSVCLQSSFGGSGGGQDTVFSLLNSLLSYDQIFLFFLFLHTPVSVSFPEFRHLAPCFCPSSPSPSAHEISIKSPGPLFPGQCGTCHPGFLPPRPSVFFCFRPRIQPKPVL